MKNVKQLVELRGIKDNTIRQLFEGMYEGQLRGSDNYFRYYPTGRFYDTTEQIETTEKINYWLEKEGYEVNLNEEYFHLLIRWDW